ncbi:MAG: M12 family metallo-peptidase [Byssovorax sp.]
MRHHSKMNLLGAAALLLALPLGAVAGCAVESPSEEEGVATFGLTEKLFEAVEDHGPSVFTARAVPKSERRVAVNLNAFKAERIVLNLPGRELVAISTAVSERGEASEWIGKIEGESDRDNEVIVARNHEAVSGYIRLNGVVYEIESTAAGSIVLFERTAVAPEDHALDSMVPDVKQDPALAGGDAVPQAALIAGNTQIDVMIVYTPAAKAMYGQAGIEAKIQTAVASANQAYQSSQVPLQLNLVHTAEVSYDESAHDLVDGLNKLQGTSDGSMDNVHALRNQYGADMVSLMFAEGGAYCGYGSIMTNVNSGFAPYAFSTVSSTCISNYSVTHELGHNMGCAHDRDNAGTTTYAYPYAYGYRYCGAGSERDLMSYSCTGSTRMNYLSNPNISFEGLPTGTVNDDCARTVRNTAGVIASFRTQARCATANEGGTATLSCPAGKVITSVSFASYGTPGGSCGSFSTSSCNAASSASVVNNACLNKASCAVAATNQVFGDPCGGTVKRLSVQYACGG